MSGGITWFKYRSLHAYNHHTTVTGGNMDFKNFGYLQRFLFLFWKLKELKFGHGVREKNYSEGAELFFRI